MVDNGYIMHRQNQFFREHAAINAGLAFQLGSVGLFLVAGLILLLRYRLLPADGGAVALQNDRR